MRNSIFVSALWLLVLAPLLVGCSVDPEKQLVGKWKGDTSAVGTAIKAAKMKADNPGVEGSAAMAAARALGATALTLN